MKGILFKPWKHKAIRENPDKEWQTRRLLNPQPFMERGVLRWQPKRTNGIKGMHKPDLNMDDHADLAKMFANYQVDEVVYIKEAWYDNNGELYYKLDWAEDQADSVVPKWGSSLFMPAWAARTFIKITSVRAERLQKITESDAEAEGFNYWEYDNPNAYADCPCTNQFIKGWDSINPQYPWSGNWWVFVYSFKLENVKRG